MNTCLSIAGSDPSGGAGIQADLKTMTINGVYAMCAITALTVQNTLGATSKMLVTPNIPEAQALSGWEIFAPVDMERAAQRIGDAYGCAVLCKGGHSLNDANDYLYRQGQGRWFPGRRIQNPNTHGTGCTLSSAIAANLAKGQDLETAVATAKEYLSGALATMLDLGHGSGPLDHAYSLRTHKED